MKMMTVLTALVLTLVSLSHAGHHEKGEAKAKTVVGSYITETGKTNPLYAGDISRQQIWLDYIEAHNDKDLKKIAEINADDWEGYGDLGEIIKVVLLIWSFWMNGSSHQQILSGL